MNLPNTSALNSKRKDEGAAKRRRLLALMPDEFIMATLAEASGLTKDETKGQILKMLRWKEIEPTTSYQKPRTYRKMSVDNSNAI